MVIHHLRCGSYCPLHSRKITQLFFSTDHFDCHCLLVETNSNLILIDTGLPEKLRSKDRYVVGANISANKTAKKQIQSLGYTAREITDIIVTHLDYDHVGGLLDFPNARLHLHKKEFEFTKQFDKKYNYRFYPELWKIPNKVITYSENGDHWNGFDSIQLVHNLSQDILLIPLAGHSTGHTGVAIKTKDNWLLHAGDAFFFKEDLDIHLNAKNFISELFQANLAMDNKIRVKNLLAISKLSKKEGIQIINSHDPRL